ncbi:membrane-associated proteins in eicosanoid and glutathione metabolism [Irpex lacteus]|nr:membrane-associated proteins in eicosanoid and glutathione metabolism [Irpex lacteus]
MSDGIAIVVPRGYSYVVAAVVSTFWLTFFKGGTLVGAGADAGIEWPQTYADKAEAAASEKAHIFNCTRDAYKDMMEALPQVYTSTLLVGLKYPIFAASACGLWSFSRIFWFIARSSGDPKKAPSYIGILGNLSLGFGKVQYFLP